MQQRKTDFVAEHETFGDMSRLNMKERQFFNKNKQKHKKTNEALDYVEMMRPLPTLLWLDRLE